MAWEGFSPHTHTHAQTYLFDQLFFLRVVVRMYLALDRSPWALEFLTYFLWDLRSSTHSFYYYRFIPLRTSKHPSVREFNECLNTYILYSHYTHIEYVSFMYLLWFGVYIIVLCNQDMREMFKVKGARS